MATNPLASPVTRVTFASSQTGGRPGRRNVSSGGLIAVLTGIRVSSGGTVVSRGRDGTRRPASAVSSFARRRGLPGSTTSNVTCPPTRRNGRAVVTGPAVSGRSAARPVVASTVRVASGGVKAEGPSGRRPRPRVTTAGTPSCDARGVGPIAPSVGRAGTAIAATSGGPSYKRATPVLKRNGGGRRSRSRRPALGTSASSPARCQGLSCGVGFVPGLSGGKAVSGVVSTGTAGGRP